MTKIAVRAAIGRPHMFDMTIILQETSSIGYVSFFISLASIATSKYCTNKNKGLRHVTVADLTKATGMAKGSFYSYYQTKEELLYAAIKIAERKGFEAAMSLRLDEGDFRENIKRALFDIYLASDSLALYLKPEDMEYLMRKLPAEIREQEQSKVENNLAQAGTFFWLPEKEWGTLAYLMDALQELASSEQDYGKQNRQQGLEILVHAICRLFI